MRTWKLVAFLKAVLPLTLTAYSLLLGPLKNHALPPYEVKWVALQDKAKRGQIVLVKNDGEKARDAVFLELDIKDGDLIDVAVGSPDGDLRTSLVEILGARRWPSVEDHVPRIQLQKWLDSHRREGSLRAINDQFHEVLLGELRKAGFKPKAGANDSDIASFHSDWVEHCLRRDTASPECKSEVVLETWEGAMRQFRAELRQAWKDSTGVDLHFREEGVTPSRGFVMAFPLQSGNTRAFFLRYTDNPVRAHLAIREPLYGTSMLESRAALTTQPLFLLVTNNWVWTTAVFTALAFSALWAWRVLTAAKLLPTYEVFNLAVTKEDAMAWCEARRRRELWIAREGKQVCIAFGKLDRAPGADCFFQCVQDRLRVDFAIHDLRFEKNEEMEETFLRYLRDFAIRI